MTTVEQSKKMATAQPDLKTALKLRDPIVNTLLALGTIVILVITSGPAKVKLEGISSFIKTPFVIIDSRLFISLMLVVGVAVSAFVWYLAINRKRISGYLTALGGMCFVAAFVLSTVAGKTTAQLPLLTLFTGALGFSVPLIFGSLSGVVCERTGVINMAIEGQLLTGAFLAAVAATYFKNPYAGLIAAPLAGLLLAILLALFAINFRTDQIVIGVVLNMLALGLTSFLYSTVLKDSNPPLNSPDSLPKLNIPLLSEIPLLGPVLFKQSLLVYIMYVVIAFLSIFLFRSRWGLRSRACGEHPKAADTVGIKVNRLRWANVLLGGMLAGMGGAFFTIGQGLQFTKNMSAGYGFIALAAMILGRWNPIGALSAAVLFGFATNLNVIMQAVNSPIPTEFVLMLPYLVTILAVAGFVGAVRPPAAENKPYPV